MRFVVGELIHILTATVMSTASAAMPRRAFVASASASALGADRAAVAASEIGADVAAMASARARVGFRDELASRSAPISGFHQ